MKPIKRISIPKQYLILLIVWAIIQSWLLLKNGIVTNLEATKYINEANHFLETRDFSAPNFYLYSTQILLIAAAIKIKAGFISVVIIQWILNLLATFMLYKLALIFLKKEWLAFLATAIFIIDIPYQHYNSYLYTESIFYSLTIIFSSYLLRIKKLNIDTISFIAIMLLLLSITRPTGILFFTATAIYLFFRFLYRITFIYKTLITVGTLIIFLAVIDQMLQTGGNFNFMLPFEKENIICGVNTTSEVSIKTIHESNSLKGIVYYIANNEEQFFRLARLKTIAFFGFTRDYYSSAHNWFLILFYYPFYLLSIVGIWKKIKQKDKSLLFMISIIILYWITTLLTCDDWHNRFILTVFPFFFLTGLAAFTRNNIKEVEN
ncbi:MAG: hypothetical protein ABIP35_16995 [Ginsengibacter sp.]